MSCTRAKGGDDTLYADTGNDWPYGGTGADEFAFADWFDNLGTNRILDFENGIDKIVLAGFGVDTIVEALDQALSQSGSNAVIELDSQPRHVGPAYGPSGHRRGMGQIDASDFII